MKVHVSEVWSLAGVTTADAGSEGPSRLAHRCIYREWGIKWTWLEKVDDSDVELGGR